MLVRRLVAAGTYKHIKEFSLLICDCIKNLYQHFDYRITLLATIPRFLLIDLCQLCQFYR